MTLPIGWIIAIGSAIGAFLWLGGHLGQLWVPQEYLVIFGCAFGAFIAANKWRNIKNTFVGLGRIFLRSKDSKAANLELLCLMFELLQKIKRDGALSIEKDVEDPRASALFNKYPRVLNKPRLVEFITDYFRMMMDGSVTLSQLESIMAQEIDVMHREWNEPVDSVATLADSLPAFGIVAAIIGVVHTLSTISAGKSPGEVGAGIAAALVGTLLGVFAAYALFLPISRVLGQIAEADIRPFEAVKEILVANYSNFSPSTAVEYGRKVLFVDQRPSMLELENGLQASTGSGLKG